MEMEITRKDVREWHKEFRKYLLENRVNKHQMVDDLTNANDDDARDCILFNCMKGFTIEEIISAMECYTSNSNARRMARVMYREVVINHYDARYYLSKKFSPKTVEYILG